MRIVMIGAGAMGCVFGAAFARAGATVTLVDPWAAHMAAIARHGLVLEGVLSPGRVGLAAVSDPAALGEADLAVVLCDAASTAAAADTAAGILGPTGVALTLQNGIGNVEALQARLGAGRVLAGSTYNSAAVLAPGRVLHSNRGETAIGVPDGAPADAAGRLEARATAIAAMLEAAGLPARVSAAVTGEIWSKFLLNCVANPVCAVTGMRPGEAVRDPDALALMEALLDEVLAVVAAKGVRLPEADPRAAVLDHCWERYNRPSMLQHLEAGRATEIGVLNGALLREAEALGVPVPVNRTMVRTVRAIEARQAARAASPQLDEAALEAAARAAPRPRG